MLHQCVSWHMLSSVNGDENMFGLTMLAGLATLTLTALPTAPARACTADDDPAELTVWHALVDLLRRAEPRRPGAAGPPSWTRARTEAADGLNGTGSARVPSGRRIDFLYSAYRSS
jgi:hypothetical protein